MTSQPTPAQAWAQMVHGNERFVGGQPHHPRQDAERRSELANEQRPQAALFGCADSRLAAEIIFDMGLGDLFVVRNAGQVISDSVVGSLEYAVAVLKVPLIVVLAHDACGAVRAAIDSMHVDADPLPAFVWSQIAPIVPAARRVARSTGTNSETVDTEEVGREHLRDTVAQLLHRSELISDAVADGRLAIVGSNYRLTDGTALPAIVVGDIHEGDSATTDAPHT